MSMRSDRSIGEPWNFKELEKVTENVMKRPDSGYSSVSVRSLVSRFSGSDSGLSGVSERSDASIGRRPNFIGKESRVSAGRLLCDVCPNPAVKTCLTCRDSYCMTCIRPHYSDPDLERHQLQDLQDQNLCQQHHKQLEFYCRTDQSAICSLCFLIDHNGHDVVEQDAHETQCKVNKTGGVPPPGQIQFPSVQPDSVTLRWSPPEGAPGPHRYRVTWRRGQEQRSIPVTGLQVQVTGLLPGEKYHFTVATLSEDGRQRPYVGGSVHTEVPMPENLTVESNSLSVSLKWTKPEGVDQVSYLLELFCEGQVEQPRSIHTDLLLHSISDLQHGNTYTVQVSTLKNDRQSKPTSKSFTTGIPVPERLTVSSITASSANLSWLVSPEMEQTPHSFLVSYQSVAPEPKSISTESCSTDITGLKPGTDYTVRVYTEVQHGGKSQPASVQIKTGGTKEDGEYFTRSVDTEKEEHRWETAEDPSKKKEEPRTTNNQKYQRILLKRSKELALSLKQLDKSEEALKKEFDEMWEACLLELTSDVRCVKDCNIWEDVMSILSEGHEERLLRARWEQADYRVITSIGDYSKYVVFREPERKSKQYEKRPWQKLVGYFKQDVLTAEHQESIKDLTGNIYWKVEKIIKKCSDLTMGYNKAYIQEIADSVRHSVSEYDQQMMQGGFAFKKMFTVDLLLFVCDVASKTLSELHTKFQKDNDVFIYLEDQRDQYYLIFKGFCQGAQSHAVLGDLICSKLELSIREAVYDQTAIDLAAEIRFNFPAFSGNRFNLERHILLSLAEEENFGKFMNYIHNPKEHFKSFITEQVKKYMATVKSPKFLSIIQGNLKHKIKCASVAAQTATEEVKKNHGDANLWLMHFSDELKDELEFAESFCVDAFEITDFDFLEEVVRKGLCKIVDQLSESLSQLSLLPTEQFRKGPDEILIEHFCKCCWVQCPFCKATCTNTLEDHPNDHSVAFHRPDGLIGRYFSGTTTLSADFCTTAIASDGTFHPTHDSEVAIPLREYRKAGLRYATWSIIPDYSELPYWKWFMCRFKDDLEKYYNKTFQGRGEIPEEWSKYTKKQAKESLDYF